MTIRSIKGQNFYEMSYCPTFEETNLVGNVYFANFVLWQGKCRERFLYEYCPEVLDHIRNGLMLITVDLDCQFIHQVFAFDELIIRSCMTELTEFQMRMSFQYYKIQDNQELLVCTSNQSTTAMREINGVTSRIEFPEELLNIIHTYELNHGFNDQ